MLAINRQYAANIIRLQDVPAEPRPGSRISYMHNGRLFTGVVWGSITTKVQRHRIDGVHPTVVEYVIEADAGQGQPWTYVTIHESEIVWSKPACPRCGDHGYLSIVGDSDTPCPVCNPLDVEGVF